MDALENKEADWITDSIMLKKIITYFSETFSSIKGIKIHKETVTAYSFLQLFISTAYSFLQLLTTSYSLQLHLIAI